MFVTSKRCTLPETISIDNVKVQVVNSFKLLGITIDNKLSFVEYASNVCRSVNLRLYSIKRLFYLSFSVKMQFFKSFILPHFDYCSTLYLYLPKVIIQKLSNLYYYCLFKLFKFNFSENVDVVNQKLSDYGLLSFQHRIFQRFAVFSHKIYTLPTSPPNLSNQLKSNVAELLVSTSNFTSITLRSRTIVSSSQSNLKYGELTFGKFFNKLLNRCFSLSDLILDVKTFLLKFSENINKYFQFFSLNFLNFNLYIKNFFYFVN